MSADPQIKKIYKLTLALFFSGALNLLLIAFVFFWTFKERPPTPYFELKPEKVHLKNFIVSPTNAGLLKRYKAMNHEQLFAKLNKKGLVEDGFTERDLSLGVLVAFYDFNLEKAISDTLLPSQKRVLSFNDGLEKVIVYPGLSEDQFEQINNFIALEKWPFKSRGLFFLLKKEQLKDDKTLHEAFFLTPEFASLERLFPNVAKENLIQMVQEGNWGLISAFYEKQRKAQDLSPENRQRLLLSYLQASSKQAANIILVTDFDFASKRLSDPTVLTITRLLDEKTDDAIKFLNAIASSPRSDNVRTLAKTKYEDFSGKKWEMLVSRPPTANKLIAYQSSSSSTIAPLPTKKPTTPTTPTTPPKTQTPTSPQQDTTYVIQKGDSLWKIAKKFNVSITRIRNANNLQSDSLTPGMKIVIPGSLPRNYRQSQSPQGATGRTSQGASQ